MKANVIVQADVIVAKTALAMMKDAMKNALAIINNMNANVIPANVKRK